MFFDDWHRMKRGVSVQGLTGDSIRRKKKKADGADHENDTTGRTKWRLNRRICNANVVFVPTLMDTAGMRKPIDSIDNGF